MMEIMDEGKNDLMQGVQGWCLVRGVHCENHDTMVWYQYFVE